MTVVGSRRRVDATLPAGVPVAELLWDLVAMLGESTDGTAARWALFRLGGHVLDSELALGDQDVADGAMLFLRDVTTPTPPPVVDDYAERVATAVDAQTGRWSSRGAQTLLVAAAGATLFAGGSIILLAGDRGVAMVAGLVGAVVATLAGLGMARVLSLRALAGAIMLAGLPLWAAAGAGIAGEAAAPSTVMLAAALATVAAGSVVAVLVAGDAVIAPAAGVIAASVLPALVVGVVVGLGGDLVASAALLGPLGLGALALAPRLAARLANLDEPDPASLAARTKRGRRILAALLTGTSLMVAGASVVIAASGGWYAWGMLAAMSVAMILKARHFRFGAEVAPLISSGIAGLVLLESSLVLQLAGTARVAGAAAVLIADALILATAGAFVRRLEISPNLRRQLGRVELLATTASVPLAVGILGAYDAVARFAHGLR